MKDPKIAAVAEARMRAWARTQEHASNVRVDSAFLRPSKVKEFIAISRECGSNGTQVAEQLGKRLQWEVLDKSILDLVADRYCLSRSGLELVDEKAINWAYDTLGLYLHSGAISHEKYMVYLERIIRLNSRNHHAIYIGRGANFFLPRERGLSVRIIAPKTFRVENIMRRNNMTKAKAKRLIQETDHGREDFVKHFCRSSNCDPHRYDLILNMEFLDVDQATSFVHQLLLERFPELR